VNKSKMEEVSKLKRQVLKLRKALRAVEKANAKTHEHVHTVQQLVDDVMESGLHGSSRLKDDLLNASNTNCDAHDSVHYVQDLIDHAFGRPIE
jgi:hypothetical protein